MKVRAGEKRPRKIKQTNGQQPKKVDCNVFCWIEDQESDEKKQPILWT